MRALRSILAFITGGSVVGPLGVVLACIVAAHAPFAREGAFLTILAATLIGTTFERVR